MRYQLVNYCIIGLALFLLISCNKDIEEPVYDKIGTLEGFLTLSPEYQPATYRNMDKLFNTRIFKRGSSVYELPYSENSLDSVSYTPDGKKRYTIDEFIKRNNISGLLIIKDGKIALERYAMGNTDSSKWTSFSVAKSVVSTLVGAAVLDGKIKSINDQVADYLPQMKGTAYDGVTIRQLMQMSSGVKWEENSTATDSEPKKLWQCFLNPGSNCMIDLMSGLPQVALPGKKFNYSTGETYLEGLVLSAALDGETLCSYLSRKIWANMGMEADGYWVLDSPDGNEFGGAFLCMTLRDYGRFGTFLLNDGVVNGIPVLPEGWIEEATKPATDSPQCDCGVLYSSYNVTKNAYTYPLGYGYNWWTMPETEWGAWEDLNNKLWWGNSAVKPISTNFKNLIGTFEAEGIFGQFVHINKKEKMVTVVWSAWKSTWIDPKEYEVYCFIDAATEVLKQK